MELQQVAGIFEGASREDVVTLSTFPVGFGDFLIGAARSKKTAELVYNELNSMKTSGFVLDGFFNEVLDMAHGTVLAKRARRVQVTH